MQKKNDFEGLKLGLPEEMAPIFLVLLDLGGGLLLVKLCPHNIIHKTRTEQRPFDLFGGSTLADGSHFPVNVLVSTESSNKCVD